MSRLVRRLADGDAYVGIDLSAPALENTPTFSLAAAAPHAVINAFFERKFEASSDNRAVLADLPGTVDARTITWKEGGRRMESAVAVGHPDCC